MQFCRKTVSLVLATLLLSACDGQLDIGCEAVAELTPICGLQAPEDIEVTPDGSALLLSQFGGIDGGPGSLARFDPVGGRAETLYPRQPGAEAVADWGDASCPGQPGAEFSPHGIDLSRRADGRWQLLVVNHGGRESVEFFELLEDAATALRWRGCVLLPPPSFLNDVVALPEGGFLVTHMFAKDSVWALLQAFLGRDSGFVWQWQPGQGLSELAGSRGAFPNGIQLSADGERVYLNLYMPGALRVIERASGRHLAELAISQPDNSSWLPDGRLLVASHLREGLLPKLCTDVHAGACAQRFQLVAVNPETLATEVLLDHAGAPMGAGTVAVPLGEHLYVGSYAGNRLLKAPLGL